MNNNSNKKDYKFIRAPRPFYMGLPLEVFNRIAETYQEGVNKYDSSPWERFYQKNAKPDDYLKMFDHAVKHIFEAYDEIVNGKIHGGAEDNLAHAVVNLCMIMWATENGMLPNKLKVMNVIPDLMNESFANQEEEKEKESIDKKSEEKNENPTTKLLKIFGALK
jgi:hypothetical protein